MEKADPVPVSQSRNVNIARSPHGSQKMKTGNTGFRDDLRRNMAMNPGSTSVIASTGVTNLLQGRSKEKKDMQELNQRFGSYIEKVRFLEAQNRKLAAELSTLRERWGQETEKIKKMYEGELKQLRKLLDESERNKAELQVKAASVEDQLSELQIQLNDAKEQEKVDQQTIEKMNQTLAEYEGEINILRKRVSRFDDERARDRKEIDRLRAEVARLRHDLDHETLEHINAQNECQTATEELEFQKQIHESELKELASLAYRDTTAENRDYWKTELSQAIHDIQSEYDSKLETLKSEMESVYSVKLSEMRSSTSRGSLEFNHMKEENARIKTQLANLKSRVPEFENKNNALEARINELMREMEELRRDHDMEQNTLQEELANARSELAQVLEELQSLLDAKLSLELEIVAYRKLLEGEEARSNEAMKFKMENRMDLVLPPRSNMSENSISKVNSHPIEATITSKADSASKSDGKSGRPEMAGGGELSARTSFQRTAKGNVSIRECTADGSRIVLENTGSKKKQDISGWSLKRDIDNSRQVITFKLPSNTVLESDGTRKVLTIWAKGLKPKGSTDLESSDTNWGVGKHQVLTFLLNEKGEERASHTAKTTYS